MKALPYTGKTPQGNGFTISLGIIADHEPSAGETYEWGGKVRTVKKYYAPTGWVYFTDGTNARFNPRTMVKHRSQSAAERSIQAGSQVAQSLHYPTLGI